MTAPVIQGWCPGALRPMMSGDGLVVRIRPHHNGLSAAQAVGLAEAALRHGNGYLSLSNRANLNIRGVRPEAHAGLVADLDALGLIDADAGVEARRNILVNPLLPEQPAAGAPCPHLAVADALAEALAAPEAPRLPAKFGFVIDLDPGVRQLARDVGDIRIESAAGPGGGIILRADGLATGRPVPPSAAAGLAIAMARWFLASGGMGPDGRGRMRDHIARGARPPQDLAGDVAPAPAAAPPRPGPRAGGMLLAFAFGQVRAETFARLATAAGSLRITPWRMIHVPQGAGGLTLPDDEDLIAAPQDPLLRVIACTGAPGCPQARAGTRDLARRIAARLPPGALAHVSGCAKGCAHPGPAPLVLTATPEGFRAARHATAAEAAARGTAVPSDPAGLDGWLHPPASQEKA